VNIIIAGEPDLGPPAKVRLKQQRRRIAGDILVDLDALVAAFMREEDVGGRDREAIGGIGRRIDADQRNILQFIDVLEIAPQASVEDEKLLLGDRPHAPADAGDGKSPAAVEIEGELAVMGRPRARRAGGDQIAIAVRRSRRRRCECPRAHRQMRESIDDRQRLIVGHMLLRLRRRDERQPEIDCFRHES
jgi:hypothetical protein